MSGRPVVTLLTHVGHVNQQFKRVSLFPCAPKGLSSLIEPINLFPDFPHSTLLVSFP